jgi:dienelactone hydrolase
MVDLTKLKNLSHWPKARKEIEAAVTAALGALPRERTELQVKVADEIQFPTHVRRRVNYFVDAWTRVSAWLFIPEGKDITPGILCCHGWVPQGKDEPAGIEGEPTLAFANHYVELGFVTLAPDCITAGERVSHGLQPFDTANFYKDNPKMSVAGKMLIDHRHALDVLCETRRVDAARLGVIGHHLGASNALFLAAFDERIQACVASCGFTRFAEDPNPSRWACDNGFVCLPRLKDAAKKKKFPFDWEHILALAAPNPTLLLTALNDDVYPRTKSCDKAAKVAGHVYKLLGEADALCNYEHRDGHRVSQEGLAQADAWFERWL